MQAWKGWPLERLTYLFLAIAYTVVWAQIYLFHGVMGDFHARPQYVPIFVTPLLVVAALWYVASRKPVVRMVFLYLFAFAVLTGLMGVYYHFEGVMEQGPVTLESLAYGPPVLLPLTYAALALMGIATALWRVKLTAPDFEQEYEDAVATRRYRGRTPA
jgi:hypothetical protein